MEIGSAGSFFAFKSIIEKHGTKTDCKIQLKIRYLFAKIFKD